MHGRKKEARVEESEEQRAAKQRKIGKYRKLCARAMAGYREGVHDEAAAALTAKLIELNPDYYTLWNYRRRIVQAELARDGADARALSARELKLVERALGRNPKSYCAWSHRLWTVEQGSCDPEAELALCAKFLALDARNFHCWDYRAQVARLVPDARRDFDFCTAKINENFSNYSAWHYRTKLLPAVLAAAGGGAPERDALMDAEFELVRQAFYTEPDDQSAWLYHRWLVLASASAPGGGGDDGDGDGDGDDDAKGDAGGLARAFGALRVGDAPAPAADPARHEAVLRRELAMCEELLEVEPHCKWAMLTSVWLLDGLRLHGHAVPEFGARAGEVLARLADLDPLRRTYYGAIRRRLEAAAA